MLHPTIVRYYGESHTRNQPCENLEALPLGEIGVDRLVQCLFKFFTFTKKAIVFGDHVILIMPISRFHIDLDKLKK